MPGSDLSFYKLDYRGQRFFPLTQSTAFRFHAELGYGDSYGSTSELPFYEHYYAAALIQSVVLKTPALARAVRRAIFQAVGLIKMAVIPTRIRIPCHSVATYWFKVGLSICSRCHSSRISVS